MPFYVTDPDNPGKHINVIELQRRNPHQELPPFLIKDWMKKDAWTRQQAIQLLAGYLPSLSEFALSDIQPRDGLDGITYYQRHINGLFNPRQNECLRDFLSLKSYSENSPSNETRKPQEWIEWADTKGFKPYWLEYAANTQSKVKYVCATVRTFHDEVYWCDLNKWLEINEPRLSFRFPEPQSAPAANAEVRLPVAAQQNNAILKWLESNKYDPLKLPVPPSGKAGVKKLCRDWLCTTCKQLFSSKSVFDTAWERLRNNHKIIDAP